jgi:hypothetical protein
MSGKQNRKGDRKFHSAGNSSANLPMKRRVINLSVLLILVAAALPVFIVAMRSTPRASGPLPHEAYVWQRAWTEPMRDAVTQHATNFSELVVLAAEVTWNNKNPNVTHVGVDFPTLAKMQTPVGLALRIGPFSGPFADNDMTTTFLTELSASLIAEALTNQIVPRELQIDFDCAESKLDGYRVWVEAIKRKISPVPVTITALPSWLNAAAFSRLAQSAGNYVLQVHSVERPADFKSPFTLCDPRAAQRAVERSARIGVPFRVALPTYGYVLAFDRNGKFFDLSAEGPRKNWPVDVHLREVRSDPVELGALVRTWTTNRPAAMRGVIWYRLPVAVDNLNWRWPTLGAIMALRSPRESFRVETRRVESGLVEINLVNSGEIDISSRLAVEVHWSDARLIAGDGLLNFTMTDNGPFTAAFQTQSQPCHLPAGEKLTLGWLRFDRDCEVISEVKKF